MRKGKGFTLIELLVAIAVIALLMAILMPTLQRVRKQGKAVVCQSNVRQLGVLCTAFVQDRDSSSSWRAYRPEDGVDAWGLSLWDPHPGRNSYASGGRSTKGMRCCPMATKPANPTADPHDLMGTTFHAWSFRDGRVGSYGTNWSFDLVLSCSPAAPADPLFGRTDWGTWFVKGASSVPLIFDCRGPSGGLISSHDPPPLYEDIVVLGLRDDAYLTCINRHDGGINMLFKDWSLRKVGLKELWTFKWNPEFDRAGPWTKAGGVRPEDWPEWMRRF